MVDPIGDSEKSDSGNLGQQVTQLASYFAPLALATIGASQCKNNQRQVDILDYSKTLAESGLQLMMAAKEGGGNLKLRT